MEERTITFGDFRWICRCCLCDCKNTISFNIHCSLVFKSVSGDVLADYASVQVSKEDVLPKQLCQQCLEDLTSCYKFIDKYKKSEQTLLIILNQKQTLVKTEEVEEVSNDIKQEEVEVSDLEEQLSQKTRGVNSEVALRALRPLNPKEKWKCKHCNKLFLKLSTLRIHSCINTNKRSHKCNECCTDFNSHCALRRHVLRKHLRKKPHKCAFCDKRFTTKTERVVHERIHTGEKPHTCKVCNRSFCYKSNLMSHLRTHSHLKSHKCGICEKSFSTNYKRVVHERIHTGEKPYTCHVCNKGFSRQWNWKTHLETHLDKKPYKCGFCERGFARNAERVVHERTHTGEKPYTCNLCKKGFSGKSSLNRHVGTHSEEKPHKCKSCNKGFRTEREQIIHERRHTGEKPYTCSVCDKGLSDMVNLKRHLRMHSVDNVKNERLNEM